MQMISRSIWSIYVKYHDLDLGFRWFGQVFRQTLLSRFFDALIVTGARREGKIQTTTSVPCVGAAVGKAVGVGCPAVPGGQLVCGPSSLVAKGAVSWTTREATRHFSNLNLQKYH
jgi:hypothetical protein